MPKVSIDATRWIGLVTAVLAIACFWQTAVADWCNALRPEGTPGPELTLAEAGWTRYVIVIPAAPSSQEIKAAAELARWLEEMTGAAYPIVPDTTPPIETEISVGRTNRLASARLPEAELDLGKEGYAIAAEDQRLFLIGGRLRGPIYAVYSLLEEDLGCRWYHLKATEIPHRPTLTFRPVVRRYVPSLSIRDPFYCDAFDIHWSLRNRTNSARRKEDTDHYEYSGTPDIPPAWGGRVVYVPGFVHTFWTLMPREEFETHPEYFALIDGERNAVQVCQTNPEVIRIFIERSLEALAERPDATILEVSPNDTLLYCQCPDCERINQENDSPAGSLIHFVNQIAEAVAASHPHVLVSTTAYLHTIDAPTQIRPRDNVAIRICDNLHSWRYPLLSFVDSDFPQSIQFREALDAWSRITDNIHIWDYTANFSHLLAPTPNLHTIQPNLEYFMAHSVQSVFYQGTGYSPGGERAPLRTWLLAKMLWDPSRQVDDLVQDFVWGYFQEAAPPILEYYELLENTRLKHLAFYNNHEGVAKGLRYDMTSPMFSQSFLQQADQLYRQAEALAPSEEIRRRVRLEHLSILYVQLVQGPEVTGEAYGAILDRFETVARRENVEYLADTPDGRLEPRLAEWRKQLEHHQAANDRK